MIEEENQLCTKDSSHKANNLQKKVIFPCMREEINQMALSFGIRKIN